MEKEIEFIQTLEELIETFSNNQVPVNKQTTDNRNPLETLITLMRQGQEMSAGTEQVYEYPNATKLERRFIDFMQHIETTSFHLDIIPYDKITESVFKKTPPEMLNKFTVELRNRGKVHFETSPTTETSSNHEKNFLKIMRHIDLALVQKDSFTNIKLKEMDSLKQDYRDLDDRYTKLKDEADRQYKNMLTQFISILGIFAAILMGAFGAIQGFTSLYDNAKDLSIGRILIISSIGASSVILILFFLLNAIAKLTERSLSSTKNKESTLFEKHPSLVLVHGILVFIVLIGSALELSNVHLQLAWQGMWWLLPLLWGGYFATAAYKRNPFFIFTSIKRGFVKTINWIKNTFSGDVQTTESTGTPSNTNNNQQN